MMGDRIINCNEGIKKKGEIRRENEKGCSILNLCSVAIKKKNKQKKINTEKSNKILNFNHQYSESDLVLYYRTKLVFIFQI